MTENSYESEIQKRKKDARLSRTYSSVLALSSIPTLAYSVNDLISNNDIRDIRFFATTFVGALCLSLSREHNAASQEQTQIAASLQAQQIIDNNLTQQNIQTPNIQ